MKQYYQANGWSRFSELDHYGEGCDPKSAISGSSKDIFKGDSSRDVVEKCMQFCGATIEDCQLDACDEPGRLDICVLEDDNGTPASEYMKELWRNKELALWSSIYTFTIKKVTEEEVNLSVLLV